MLAVAVHPQRAPTGQDEAMKRSNAYPRILQLMIAIGLAVLMTGCLPAALDDARPDAAVITAPANAAAPGSGAALDRALRELASGHDFASAARMRFLEVRSGLIGSQVVPGAARIARSSSAGLAVIVQPSTLSRAILDPDGRPTERLVLQLDVLLVRASDATELGRLAGPRRVGERPLPGGVLPPLDEDPLYQAALTASIEALAPRVAREMQSIAVSGSSDE